mmetsp:Transcript_4328/g.7376  ORF Transcript_4328/g.7376 Transcript_4328/m.7376 type:complete len:255 (+) Transcript_4328:380-1144(+)
MPWLFAPEAYVTTAGGATTSKSRGCSWMVSRVCVESLSKGLHTMTGWSCHWSSWHPTEVRHAIQVLEEATLLLTRLRTDPELSAIARTIFANSPPNTWKATLASWRLRLTLWRHTHLWWKHAHLWRSLPTEASSGGTHAHAHAGSCWFVSKLEVATLLTLGLGTAPKHSSSVWTFFPHDSLSSLLPTLTHWSSTVRGSTACTRHGRLTTWACAALLWWGLVGPLEELALLALRSRTLEEHPPGVWSFLLHSEGH